MIEGLALKKSLLSVASIHRQLVTLAKRLSNALEARFCLNALDEALQRGRLEIFNTDLGLQFTSREYTGRLVATDVAVSRDG